jgi:hypothetical protein
MKNEQGEEIKIAETHDIFVRAYAVAADTRCFRPQRGSGFVPPSTLW